MLQRLLEDPEVLAAAEDTGQEPLSLPAGGTFPGALPPEFLGKLPALMGALGAVSGSSSGKKDDKTTLLLALKPYMNPQRCDAIDKLIMLSRLGEVMHQLR